MLNIQENISLAQYATFRIGGPAKFFVEVISEAELVEALNYAKEKKLEYFVLGGGSNVLFSDQGFKGIIIKIHNSEFIIHNSSIEVGAGVPLAKIIREAGEKGLSGLEWAAGIPGTVGGAIRGNAGAFGGSMSDSVLEVKVLKSPDLQIINYKSQDCLFSYRDSIFKQNKNLIILLAELRLKSGTRDQVLAKNLENIKKRVANQPQGVSSAGSYFLNPVVTDEKLISEFEKDKGVKIKENKLPAGWLIDQAGLRGKQIGGALLSEKHPNFLVNTGGATAEDVIILESLVKQQVRDKFGVQLESEVEHVGF